MTIGEKIKFYRNEKGLTQNQLSELSGISEISIRKYEAGDRIPKISNIEAIAEALKINVSHLYSYKSSLKENVIEEHTGD